MRQSTRLIVNTTVTYGRMLITVGIGLLAIRLLIGSIGISDYGLMTAVGASGVFVSTITSSLVLSGQRFLAYELGRNDAECLKHVFNTLFGIFLGMAGLAWIMGFLLQPVLFSVLNVPEGRDTAAFWIFHLTLIQMALIIALTPFSALLNAHQQMVLLAGWQIVVRIAELGAVLAIPYLPGDKLVSYVATLSVLTVLNALIPMLIGLGRYRESRPDLKYFRKSLAYEIFAFAGWAVFAQIAWALRHQGSILIMNFFFGPVVNGAFSIALLVSGYQNQITTAILSAIQPAMSKLEGAGQREQVKRLTGIACKFSVLASFFFWVPLMVETESILRLWLGDFPAESVVFVRLVTTTILAGLITYGYHLAMEAKGRIAAVTLMMALPQLFSIVIACIIFLKTNLPAWIMPALTLVAIGSVSLFVRPWYVGKQLDFSGGYWLRSVFVPVTLVGLAGAVGAVNAHLLVADEIQRVVGVVLAYSAIALPAIWLVGLEASEKEHFIRLFRAIISRP
jgi:O-antigen/teichoic acid export membrane protein